MARREQSFSDYLEALRVSRPAHLVNVVVLAEVDSTNLLGRRIVGEYLREEMTPPRAVLVAHAQSAGRGRLGRVWASPPGAGVYASILLPEPSAEALTALPMAVGVGLVEALASSAGVTPRLKWPNDLLLDGAKVGGILVESVARGSEVAAAVVGFGVNLGDRTGLPPGATSVAAQLAASPGRLLLPTLPELTWTLVAAVQAAIVAGAADLPRLVARYRELSAHRPGDPLVWQNGEERVEGTFVGFDARGRLRVADAGGAERLFAAGEVFAP